MDCLDAKQKLEPCARGELSPVDRAELDRHLVTCEGCRLELELTRAVLGTSAPVPLEDPSFEVPSPEDPALEGPAFEDPVLEDEDLAPSASFDSVSLEPSIEQERLPQPPSDGPGPPRVLTTQLPEDTEETLDLSSLHPADAYDPGAIDLPHSEPSAPFDGSAPNPAESSPAELFSAEEGSLADLAMDSPALASPPKAVPASGATGGSVPGTGASWDFEPVDVPRTPAPPEESLSFAKEALDRKRGKALRGKKNARALLWVGGAVGGVGLLGASVWMALAFRDAPVGHEPANIPAVQPPPGAAPADSVASVPEGTPGMTAADSVPGLDGAPAVMKAGATGAGTMPEIAQPKGAPAGPSAVKTPDPARASGAQGARAPSTAGVSPTGAGKPAASPDPVAFRDDELAPAPRRAPPILTVEPDARPGSEPADDPEPVPAQEPVKSVSTSPIFVPPGGTKPSNGTAKPPAEEPSSGTPIGKLHLATVTAEKGGDLEALRKLKTSWKSMIRSSTGADRARSKKEYADCLWAIQELTSRDADRKEALAAYRDYVLYAPAGGADARTVSRMRHLEDILSDTQ